TGRSCSIAQVLMAFGTTCCPRPAGRSGCVYTATTSALSPPSVASHSSSGSAIGSEPRNTRRSLMRASRCKPPTEYAPRGHEGLGAAVGSKRAQPLRHAFRQRGEGRISVRDVEPVDDGPVLDVARARPGRERPKHTECLELDHLAVGEGLERGSTIW